MGVSRAGQRALLRQGHWPRSESLWSLAGSPLARLSTGSVRERAEVSGRRDRRARQDDRARLVLRPSHRHRRPPAVSEPGLRRTGGEELGCESLLHRQKLLQLEQVDQAVSRRHVVRVLPYRPEPGETAGGPGKPHVGEPQLERRGAVLLDRSDFLLEQRSDRLRVPALSHVAPRFARHFAGLDRQHQQPEDDERRLSSAAAASAGEAVGQGEAERRRAEQHRTRSGRRGC